MFFLCNLQFVSVYATSSSDHILLTTNLLSNFLQNSSMVKAKMPTVTVRLSGLRKSVGEMEEKESRVSYNSSIGI